MYYGSFTSKNGIQWNYSITPSGYVDQYHPTMVRCAGGWKDGPEVRPSKISRECFENIKGRYGFDRDPDYNNLVIITDLSKDTQVAEYRNKYKDIATISITPEGRFRVVEKHCGRDIRCIYLFDNFNDAHQKLMDSFWDWTKI